jgi:mono/diheme cytochrome c family protein
MKGIIAGIVLALVAELLGGYVLVVTGRLPANADAKPPRLERWAAHKSLDATVDREAPAFKNPLPADDSNMVAGAKLYAANCAVCHGASDGSPSNVAKGLYQHAPQFAKHDVSDDPEGETYWKIIHGVRLTGMPSYRATLSETQMWQITTFLKHLDKPTPAVEKAWRAIPSQAAGS